MRANKAKAGLNHKIRPTENAFRELIRTFGLAERVMQPYFARFGISGSQWGVLRNLNRAEQEGQPGLRLKELSNRLLVRPPSVTGVVDRLERAGLVVRHESAADLRAKQVGLTGAGRQLVARILEVHEDQMQTVLAGLSETEQAELYRLLLLWRQHLERVVGGVCEGRQPSKPDTVGSLS
jgi:DNA-binding MarR family transcriptional regulator